MFWWTFLLVEVIPHYSSQNTEQRCEQGNKELLEFTVCLSEVHFRQVKKCRLASKEYKLPIPKSKCRLIKNIFPRFQTYIITELLKQFKPSILIHIDLIIAKMNLYMA